MTEAMATKVVRVTMRVMHGLMADDEGVMVAVRAMDNEGVTVMMRAKGRQCGIDDEGRQRRRDGDNRGQ
ncbi:S-malonyltransferase [Sesbania bispinosa]|nr:S-malonyltransferase [Sesbania bispinosa]